MNISPLATYTNLTTNCTKMTGKVNDTVTIHCFVGQVTAKRGVDFFMTSDQSSCQYVVGHDGSIGCSVDECNRAWTTGGKYTVNGETGSQNDRHAITIEVACDTTHPYAITDKAMEALICLLVDICKRNPSIGRLRWKADKNLVGKPAEQNMTAHRWFAAKACPGDYLYNRFGEIAAEVNRRLDEEENAMNEKLIRSIVQEEMEKREAGRYYTTLQDIPESYFPSVKKLMDAKILSGYNGGKDGDIDTIEDNVIKLDETACRIITLLDRAGAFENLKREQ